MKLRSSTQMLRQLLALLCVASAPLSSSISAADGQPLAAANRAATPVTSSVVRDVRLQGDGSVQLRLLNTSGHPRVEHVVRCLYDGNVIAKGKTNANGVVRISNLRAGIHSVAVGHSVTVYRFWNPGTAPPSAIASPAIVASDETLRGQYGYGYGPPTMMAPGMLATGVTIAAVVAILAGKSSANDSTPDPVTPASP